MTVYRGSTKVIQSPEERKAEEHARQRAIAQSVADAQARRVRLLLGKTIVSVQFPEDSPTETLLLVFADGSRVRIEPSEWLDITEEK